MSAEFTYSTRYKLDKSHFTETFEESSPAALPLTAYLKALALIIFGIVLLLSELSAYVAWFMVAAGILEAASVFYRKPWWLARQMISRAANTQLSLTINEEGIKTQSSSASYFLPWSELSRIEATQRGWLLHHKGNKTYLSRRCLSEAANEYINEKSLSL